MKLEIKNHWAEGDGDLYGPGGILNDDFPEDKANYSVIFGFSVGKTGSDAASDFEVQVRSPNYQNKSTPQRPDCIVLPVFDLKPILATIESVLRLAETKGPNAWEQEIDRFFLWEYRDYVHAGFH